MAFNPFHGFRKHQKTLFAIMVIVCMFVFILQFGAGDAIQRALSWFGGGRNKGTHVATLDGNKVYEADLNKLFRERQMASTVVIIAALQADRAGPENRSGMFAQQLVQFATQFNFPPFGRFSSVDDLLDFIIWRDQADKLGITLTEADVRRAINRIVGKDVFGGKPFTQSRLIEAAIGNSSQRRGGGELTTKEILDAVTDEFRVLLAQEAILGQAPGIFGFMGTGSQETSTPAVTPGEFLQYYREQRATLNVWMLPVDVDSFIAKAKEMKKPSEAVLEKLFDNYKGVEPSPERDRPAFKEPARVKAEWVSAGPDLAYFKQQAKQRLAMELPGAASPASLALSVSGIVAPGAASPWAALGNMVNTFDRTLFRYADYVEKQRATILFGLDSPRPIPHDRSYTHPGQLGRAVGAFTASATGWNGSFSVLSTAYGSDVLLTEVEEILRLESVQFSQQFGYLLCPPLNASVVPPLGPLAYRTPINDYSEMRPKLLEQLEQDELTNPVTGVISVEMNDLMKEIAKSKGNVDEARKKIDEAVKKYGLVHGAMPKALDKYDLEKDESVKKVRDEYLESQHGVAASRFADFLLKEMTATYDPKEFHRTNGETFLVWQTELVRAREPKFAEARDKVVDAWYLQEARFLARKQAEEWSAEAKKLKGSRSPEDVIKTLSEQGKNDGFSLNGVARLVSQTAQEAAGGKTYEPYKIEASKIAFPRPNTVDLMVKQLKDPGDSMVISDRPERHYYVAVLKTRDNQAGLTGFENVLSKTPIDDKLWTNDLLPAKRRDHVRLVMKQLRTDAGAPLTENGEYDLPKDIRIRGVDTGEGD